MKIYFSEFVFLMVSVLVVIAFASPITEIFAQQNIEPQQDISSPTPPPPPPSSNDTGTLNVVVVQPQPSETTTTAETPSTTSTLYISDSTETTNTRVGGLTSVGFEMEATGSGSTTIENLPAGNYSINIYTPGTSSSIVCNDGQQPSNVKIKTGEETTCAAHTKGAVLMPPEKPIIPAEKEVQVQEPETEEIVLFEDSVGPESITLLPTRDLFPRGEQGKLKIVVQAEDGDTQVSLKSNFLSSFSLTTGQGTATEEFDLNPGNYGLYAQVSDGWSIKVKSGSLLLDKLPVVKNKITTVFLAVQKPGAQKSKVELPQGTKFVEINVKKTVKNAPDDKKNTTFMVSASCSTKEGKTIPKPRETKEIKDGGEVTFDISAPGGDTIVECTATEVPKEGWEKTENCRQEAAGSNIINCRITNEFEKKEEKPPKLPEPGEPEPEGNKYTVIVKKVVTSGSPKEGNEELVKFPIIVICKSRGGENISPTPTKIELSDGESKNIELKLKKGQTVYKCQAIEQPPAGWKLEGKPEHIINKENAQETFTLKNKRTSASLEVANITVKKVVTPTYPEDLEVVFEIDVTCYHSDDNSDPVGSKALSLKHKGKPETVTITAPKDEKGRIKFIHHCTVTEPDPNKNDEKTPKWVVPSLSDRPCKWPPFNQGTVDADCTVHNKRRSR